MNLHKFFDMPSRSWKLVTLAALTFLMPVEILAKEIFYPAQNKSPKRLIVFVHGLGGDARSTWENSDSKFFWPEAFSKDPALKDADVLSFEYNSGCRGELTISEISRNLADGLRERLRERKYKHLSFIAHSLGGQIVRELVAYERIDVKKIKDLVFLAAPSLGASLANYGQLVCNGKQIADLKPGRGSTIDRLNDQWRDRFDKQARQLPFSYLAAYEVLSTYMGVVVDKDSAVAFSQTIKASDTDHFRIAKPSSVEDPVYKWARTQLIDGNVTNAGQSKELIESERALHDYFYTARSSMSEERYNALLKAYYGGFLKPEIPKSDFKMLMNQKAIFRGNKP